MSEIGKTITKFVFYLVAIVLLAWTASLTVSFVASALPTMPWYVPYLSLVVFDGGMIAWLFVFLKYAQGTIQRATALGLTGWNFLGVSLLVVAEILLGGQTMTEAPEGLGTWAIWGIGIWTVVNVLGVLLFHIGDPDAQVQMSIQNEKDAIFRGALANLGARRVENSRALADTLGARMYDAMLAELFVDRNGDGIPDALQSGQAVPGQVIASQTQQPAPQPQPQQPEARPSNSPLFGLPRRVHDLDTILSNAGMTRESAKATLIKYRRTTAEGAYSGLKMLGKLPESMTLGDFKKLFSELVAGDENFTQPS